VERIEFDDGEEVRTFTATSDTPYVRVKIQRRFRGAAQGFTTVIGTGRYDRLTTEPFGVEAPARFLLQDSSGRHPALAILVLGRGALSGFRFVPGGELTLAASAAGEFELAFVLPQGIYEGDALGYLQKFLEQPEERVALDGEGAVTVFNPLPVPVVKVVRVAGAGEMPFQVREFGRWVFRGAQPSLAHAGEDYCKCYLPARGSALVQRYGWMDGVARPGWGCQQTVALSECRRQGAVVSLEARVRSVTAFLFAPRVRFRNPIASVRLDGRAWQYFDGRHVFLPNRPGRYRVEVREGTPGAPHVARTSAHVEHCEWSGTSLRFDARLPVWMESVPEGFWFSALIRHPGRSLASLRGGRLIRTRDGGASVVSFQAGTVEAGFSGGGEVPRLDVDADIASHLAAESVTMVEPYLAGLAAEVVPLRGVNRAALARFGVVVWNHFFLEALPADFPGTVLREWVTAGGGLVLLTNALRALPQLLGGDAGAICGHTMSITAPSDNSGTRGWRRWWWGTLCSTG